MRWPFRLQTRLILLAVVIIVPAMAVITYDQSIERETSRQRARQDTTRLARLAADQQSSVFQDVHHLLAVLSVMPSLRESEPAACNAVLQEIVRERVELDVLVVSADGALFCYGRRPDRTQFQDRAWFTRAMRTKAISIGDYQTSPITGKPTVVLAEPVFSAGGAVRRVVAASVSLDKLNALAARAQIPGRASLTLANRDRIILARYPDPSRWIGRALDESSFVRAAGDNAGELFDGVGVDGIARLFAIAPVITDVDAGLFVVMGTDPATVFADTNQLLARHLALLGLVTLFGVGAAAVGGQRFLVRPAAELKQVVNRIAAGELGAREPRLGVAEFNDVVTALNAMAGELQSRHDELHASEERYRQLFERNPRPLWVFDSETLQFLAVNDAAVDKYGYSRSEFLSMSIADIRPADEVPRLLDALPQIEQSWTDSALWRHRLKSGELITVKISSYGLTFDSRPARLVAATDVTAEVESARALSERAAASALSARVGAALNGVATLNVCLAQCASAIVEHVDAAFARIWTVNVSGDVLELQASAGMYTHTDGAHRSIPVGQFKIGRIARDRKPHLTNEVIGDPEVHDQEWARRERIVAFAGYPLIVDDQLVGVLALFARHPMTDVVLGALGAVADHIALGVTRRKLEDSHRLLASLVEASDDAIIGRNREGTIVSWNSGASRLYGYSAEEAVGRHMSLIVPSDRQFELRPLQPDVEGGEHVRHYETARNRKDGSRVEVSLTLSPIAQASGEVVGISEIARDITAQRQAEVALRDAEERMRVALEASHVGVWDANLQTNTTYWSEICEKMHGLAPGTFGGTLEAFEKQIIPEDRAHVLQLIEQDARSGSHFEFVYRTAWPDGTVHYINTTAHFHGDGGRPTRATGVTSDITERRSLEDQLRQAQKMEAVGQLAGGVAHDFNNMLTAILGYAELLETSFEPGDRALKDLEQIRRSAERAATLTRQLLAFSRRQVLQLAIVDVNGVVSELGSLLRRLIGEDIELDLRLDPHIDRIKADSGQLEQVIMNVAVNARDAMPSGGRLTIKTDTIFVPDEFFRRHGITVEHDTRRFTRLSMTDTGIGMDEQTKRRIFEPFFTTKPKGQGTGLGLATVYGIVKQSGGFIFVDSAPGCGTTFDIYLPCTEDVEPERVAVAAERLPLPGSECILLVEDEHAVRVLSRDLLQRGGYRVIEASDADSAQRCAAREGYRIDLLLTDVVMPGHSGPELYAALQERSPNLKVLFMSGYTDDAIVRKGVLEPGTPFLQKPFTSGGLLQKVREVLNAGGV